jgi:hypothetical protein
MADATLPLTHYLPWDGDEQKAVCGTSVKGDTTLHSLNPTCAICAAALAAEDDKVDAAVEWTILPLDAAEADALAPETPMSPVGASLFALGVSLNRSYATILREADAVAFGPRETQLVLKGIRR